MGLLRSGKEPNKPPDSGQEQSCRFVKRRRQMQMSGSGAVTCCVRAPADAVHADPSPVGHFHPGGGEAPHRHVVHRPEDTQE